MALPSIINVRDHGVAGDGCTDDTAALQALLNELKERDTPEVCERGGVAEQWPPWAVALRFPAGVYRITAPLYVPAAYHFRLFGDGGRGGIARAGEHPHGAVIRQDTDGKPILVFEHSGTHNWIIERLGFMWKNPQAPAPRLGENDPPADMPQGAVAVLFAVPSLPPSPGPQPPPEFVDYYHGTIRDCWVYQGWRGVAIDDRAAKEGGVGNPIALWGTEIASSVFVELTGAAVRLSSPTGTNYGMPGNALRDLFVQNVMRANEEHQIHLNAQSACTVENLDLEGSTYHQVLYLWGGGTIRNLHLEHLEVHTPYYRLIFVGGGPVTIDGLDVDGVLDAKLPNGQDTYGSIIESYGPSLVLSGAQGFRGKTQASGGIALEGGHAYLVKSEAGTEVRLVGHPRFPNARLPVGGNPNDGYYKYQVHLWNADPALFAPTANVVAEPVKARVTLATTLVEAGKAAAQTVAVPGARPGDVVALGPPPGLYARLLFSGVVVADDEVEVRFFNPDAADATVVGVWTVTAGSGPLAGGPQFVDGPTAADPPWPNPKAPY